MDKKNLYSTIILILLIVVIVVLMVLSSKPNNNNQNTNSDSNVLKTFFINKDGPIPPANCEAADGNNKIIIIESKYCSACKEFLKTLDNLKDSPYIFHLYDITESEKRDFIENTLKVDAQYYPTSIIGCDAYIGAMDENTLLEVLSTYELEQK